MKKIAILFLFFLYLNVFADENHYINILIGDRAAGMGGAYTAIADGPEGVFYNPAGLAFSSSKYFSLSVNTIQYKMLYYHNVYKKSDGTPFDYIRHSFSFLPNFFGFIQKTKKFTFAITVSCPDSEFYDQRDNATINIDGLDYHLNVNFNYTDMIYELGPSFAFLPHKKVAIGFSVFIRYRDIKNIIQTSYNLDTYINNVHWSYLQTTSIYNNSRIIGFTPQFGLQFMPISKLSIGYNISMPFDIVNIYSTQSTDALEQKYFDDVTTDKWISTSASYNNIKNNQINVLNIFQHGLFTPLYIKQSLGFGIFISKSILLSIDGFLYIPIQDYNIYINKNRRNELLNVTGNVAIGFVWYITPNFPFRVGLFTNFTNTQEIKNGDTDMKDWIHLFGGSFSLGFSTSDLSINFGAVVSGGGGKAQIIGGVTDIQDLTMITANIFISGGYQF